MRRHLYYYTHVDVDPEVALRLLADDPGRWLPDPATAFGDGWFVDLDAEGVLPRPVARHGVVVDVGPALHDDGRKLRSLTWRSASAPGIFPVFEGDIELSALSQNACQLSLMGTYRPPLSVAGSAGDALLGHHVAEACVRRFVLGAADRLAAVPVEV